MGILFGGWQRYAAIGRFVEDPTIKTVGQDVKISDFRLAVNQKYSGSDRKDTTYLPCKAWGKAAQAIYRFGRKGRLVLIEGRLSTETWEDKNTGKQNSRLVVTVHSCEFMDDKTAQARTDSDGTDSGSWE
jgi:single-strand DNA-binding protein